MNQARRHVLLFVIVLVVMGVLTGCQGSARLADLSAMGQQAAAQAAALVSDPAGVLPAQTNLAPAVPAGAGAGEAAVAALEGVLSNIYEEVGPSVVNIQHSQGEGSGFVWDSAGHIVSNNHVIEGADRILVTFADGTVTEGRVIGTDPDSDLAVLQVDLPAAQLRPVTLADSTQLKVGELAIAIGNPFGQAGTMTVGFVSALGRRLEVDSTVYNIPDVIQTDAAINPGNSGGVLLNPQGEVVGVTSAIISPVAASSGIGFAIPSVIVQRVVPALIANGSYQHPYLGISGTTLTTEMAAQLGLPAGQRGALIVQVVSGGPAAAAGLQGSETSGDVVTAVDGQPVDSIDDLISYLARYGTAGELVNFTVLRSGQTLTVPVTLGTRPG
ncbi:MAG: trypsin-like peptidase domain-containing protein [Pseudomonadales bacterium]|nr:trypsin-like peptidase domain-containing protein [Ardenticatenaceae bacterium]MCP5191080.1 trypsin-like peptidase domain-containing protein [Pseudomonadales bacterium]